MDQQRISGSIGLVPVFFLRGIDPLEVKRQYESGAFENAEICPTTLGVADVAKITAPTYGKDASSPRYSFQDHSSMPMYIATTNIDAFEFFNETGGKLLEGGRCDWCKQDFTGPRHGTVVKYEEVIFLTLENGKYCNKPCSVFWIEGCCHSDRCALAILTQQMNAPARVRRPCLGESEELLRHKYFVQTGRYDLHPAPPFTLHSGNGGPLSPSEFDDPGVQYFPSREILCIPAKPEYIAKQRS